MQVTDTVNIVLMSECLQSFGERLVRSKKVLAGWVYLSQSK